jgi:drug/metabolite transporter (DMT)-like permease
LKTAVCLTLVVLGGTGGDLCFAHAMKRVGELASFRWANLSRMFGRAARMPLMWIGIALQAVAFLSFAALLTWADVSFVVPATALSYAVGAAGAAVLLGERVTTKRWAGVVLISSGVLLVLLG